VESADLVKNGSDFGIYFKPPPTPPSPPPKRNGPKNGSNRGIFIFVGIKPKPMLAKVLLGFPNVWD
jgi:hypothetical protein